MRLEGRSIPEIIGNADETDLRILETARLEFSSNGFHGANMDVIASESGVGKGTVYRRFESKQLLFFCLMEWIFSGFMSFLEETDDNIEADAFSLMEQHIRRSRVFFADNIDLIRLYVHEQSRILEGCSSDYVREWGMNYHKRLFRFWVELAGQAAASGALKVQEEPELIGNILGGMAHTIYSDLILSEGPFPVEEYRRREDVFLQIVKNGLFTNGG